MEITADVSFIILLLGLTGLLAGYFFYVRPLQMQRAEPGHICGSSRGKPAGPKFFDGIKRLHWVRRKVPGARSGRRLASGEEESSFIMSIYNFS